MKTALKIVEQFKRLSEHTAKATPLYILLCKDEPFSNIFLKGDFRSRFQSPMKSVLLVKLNVN